jgi:hypothetical protein
MRFQVSKLLNPFVQVEYLLALTVCLCVYGDAFPYGIPLVLPMIITGLVWFAFVRRRLRFPTNTGYLLFILCFAFYLVGILNTSHLYALNVRDLRNGLAVLILGPLLYSVRESITFERFRNKSQSFGALAASALAVVGLYKFHTTVQGRVIKLFSIQGREYPWGTSLITDYNFYAFAMLAGAISCLFCMLRCSSLLGKTILFLGFAVTLGSMSLSGSRRGWVIEVLLIAVLFGHLVYRMIIKFVRHVGRVSSTRVDLTLVLATLTVAMVAPFLIERFQAAFRNEPVQRLQNQIQKLEARLNTLSDPAKSFSGRSGRWTFTLDLLDETSAVQLLFGRGFDYLPMYAVEFHNSTPEDDPHNPILSALLFSGVVGCVPVCLLILLAAIQYLKRTTTDLYFASLYAACLFFVIPSYNSIFSGKFFGVLLLLPWSIPILVRFDSHVTRPIYCSKLV